MTKEDYMHLPKERLAELLAERDKSMQPIIKIPMDSPRLQCYEPGGTCINPFRDCINCPKQLFNNPHEVFTLPTSHLEELQPDGTYKPCGEREATGVLKDFIEQMKTPVFDEGIDISFGAIDSELYYQEIQIPDGMVATIEGRKIILKREE